MDNALTVQLQHGGGQEKIWSQGEKSRGIWMATEVTFHTARPAQVSSARGRKGGRVRVEEEEEGKSPKKTHTHVHT